MNVKIPAGPTTMATNPRMISLLLGAIIVWCVCCISLHPYHEPDLFWQLRAGHDIVSTGHAPHADAYTWDCRGETWIVPEWLTFVLYSEVYQHCGALAGVLGVRMLLNASMFVLLFSVVKKSTRSAAGAFLISIVSATACANFFQTRPYQISFLLLVIVAAVLAEARKRGARVTRLHWLAPLCAVWANLHQGYMIAIGMLAVCAGVDAIESLVRRMRKDNERAIRSFALSKQFAGASIACAGASLLTPYGIDAYRMAYATVTSPISHFIVEWEPLRFSASLEIYALIALVTVTGVAFIVSARRTDYAVVAIILILAQQAMQHQRNVPVFVLVTSVLAAPQIAAMFRLVRRRLKLTHGTSRKSGVLVMAGVVTWNMVVWTQMAQAAIVTCPPGPASLVSRLGDAANGMSECPLDAVQFLRGLRLPNNLRLFNDLGDGGFYIWRMPEHPVFIDGRNDLFLNGVLADYIAATSAHSRQEFFQILGHYDFECIVTGSKSVKQFVSKDPDWVAVYSGANEKATTIYLRRSSRLSRFITEGPSQLRSSGVSQ